MNKWTYPTELLTWGRLAMIISEMSLEQKEMEVVGYGYQTGVQYMFVKLRKLLVTTEADIEICESGQPILLW